MIVGVAGGERPGALQVAGMVAGIRRADPRDAEPPARAAQGALPRQALALGAVAALGFGGFYVAMDAAVADAEPFWALLTARASAAAALVAGLVCLRPRLAAAAPTCPRWR